MTPTEEEYFEQVAVRAQSLARSGKPGEAEELARQVPSAEQLEGYFHEKVLAFVEIASGLAVARSPRAESVLREAEALAGNLRRNGIWHEGNALLQLSDVWAVLGKHDECLRLLRKAVEAIAAAPIRDDGSYSVLAALSRKLRDLGATEEAERLKDELPRALAESRGWLW